MTISRRRPHAAETLKMAKLFAAEGFFSSPKFSKARSGVGHRAKKTWWLWKCLHEGVPVDASLLGVYTVFLVEKGRFSLSGIRVRKCVILSPCYTAARCCEPKEVL